MAGRSSLLNASRYARHPVTLIVRQNTKPETYIEGVSAHFISDIFRQLIPFSVKLSFFGIFHIFFPVFASRADWFRPAILFVVPAFRAAFRACVATGNMSNHAVQGIASLRDSRRWLRFRGWILVAHGCSSPAVDS
jgi:hypothetical protein